MLSLVNPFSHLPQISFTFLSIKLVIPTQVWVHESAEALLCCWCCFGTSYNPSTEPLH